MKIKILCLLSRLILFLLKHGDDKIVNSPRKMYLTKKEGSQYTFSELEGREYGSVIDFKDIYYFPTVAIHLLLFLFKHNQINLPIKIRMPKVNSQTLREVLTP